MTPPSNQPLKDRIFEIVGRRIRNEPAVIEDTSAYMSIVGGAVIRIGADEFYIITDATENRFGVDDQPKFWVKYAIDLNTGQRKVIKLVFHEEFTARLGPIRIRCRRNPRKESGFLDIVRGDPRFMQGHTIRDRAGNEVRVIDIIPGQSLYHYLTDLDLPHDEYHQRTLPQIMSELIPCIEALARVHRQGFHHGDVRTDHIWIEHSTGRYKWIDFDYEVSHTDYDVWSIGNLLIRVVGNGIHTLRDCRTHAANYPGRPDTVGEADMALLLGDRVANLQKLYPYIATDLNRILMRFANSATDFYGDLEHLSADLRKLFG